MFKHVLELDPENDEALSELGNAYSGISNIYSETKMYANARDFREREHKLILKRLNSNPNSAALKYEHSISLARAAYLSRQPKRPICQNKDWKDAKLIMIELERLDPDNRRWAKTFDDYRKWFKEYCVVE